MILENMIIPFIVGLATNKMSDELFKQKSLYKIIEENYDESVDEFNKKYRYEFDGRYHDFLSKQENMESMIKSILKFDVFSEIETREIMDLTGDRLLERVLHDFIEIFQENLSNDERLYEFWNVREHQMLTKSIIEEIKELKRVKIKKFIRPEEFFSFETDNSRAIKKLNREMESVIEFLKIADIVVVDSFRGHGKTETLKNISVAEKTIELFKNVIVMRHGIRSIVDAIQTELHESEKDLILIDDSDLCLDEVKDILNIVRSFRGRIKIVMSVQTYSCEIIKGLIIDAGLVKKSKFLCLNHWTKEDYIQLLRTAANVKEYIDEEIIVAKYPSPVLIRWIAEMNNTEDEKNIVLLFEEQKVLMEKDTYEVLSNYIPREECKKILLSLCCIVPFVMSSNQCSEINKSVQGNYEIEKLVLLLQKGGVMRKVGNKYRFYPDIKGDIFLSHELNDSYDPSILNYWIKKNQKKTLENLKRANFVNEIDIQDKLKGLVDYWVNDKDYFDQKNNLELAVMIASFCPEQVISLIYSYLEGIKNSVGDSTYRLSTDDFAPVLLEIWKAREDKEAILSFLCSLEKYKMDGYFDNYKVMGITREIFSPISNSYETIIHSLALLEKWIIEGNEEALTLFKYAASELLKGNYEITKKTMNGVQFSRGIIELSDKVISVRNNCIMIIENLLKNNSDIRIIKVIESICFRMEEIYIGGNDSIDSKHEEILRQEREILVKALGNNLISSHDIPTNIIIEKILLYWWARQSPGCESADKYLLQFKRSSWYLFAKYYVDADYRIISFDEIYDIAPTEDRWKWFVYEIKRYVDDERDDTSRIARMLSKDINGIEELYGFLSYEYEVISNLELTWLRPSTLLFWSEYDIELFYEFFKSDYYLDISELFKAPIFESVIRHREEEREEIVLSALNPEYNLTNAEINTLLNVSGDDFFEDSFVVKIIDSIIDDHNYDFSSNLIYRLYFIFNNRERGYLADILIKILQKYPVNESVIEMLDFLIQHYSDDIRESSRYKCLKEIVLEKVSLLDSFSYHENSLLEQILLDEVEALDFLEVWLKSNNKSDDFPYEGFPFLVNFTTDIENYELVVIKLLEFRDNGLMSDSELKRIIKPLLFKKDIEGKFIILNLLRYYIVTKNTTVILALMGNYKLNRVTAEVFLEIIKYLDNNGHSKEAEKIIYEQIFPDKGWSSSIGQKSPDLVNRVSLYVDMYNQMPYGRLKLAVSNCIDYLHEVINNGLIEDEEILNPR